MGLPQLGYVDIHVVSMSMLNSYGSSRCIHKFSYFVGERVLRDNTLSNNLTLFTVIYLTTVYLPKLCTPIGSINSRTCMHSAFAGYLIIPPTITSFADRTFASSGLRAWNSLPSDIKWQTVACKMN